MHRNVFFASVQQVHIISLSLVTSYQEVVQWMIWAIKQYSHVAMLNGIMAVELKPGVLEGAMSKNGVIGPLMPANNV
jgi:hypothetical protein